MSSAYRSTSRSVKECASMEQLISLSQNLSNVAWPNKNFENKISKLVMPSPANLTEFLVGLVEERADDNMADNIYLLSLMFPYLGVGASDADPSNVHPNPDAVLYSPRSTRRRRKARLSSSSRRTLLRRSRRCRNRLISTLR